MRKKHTGLTTEALESLLQRAEKAEAELAEAKEREYQIAKALEESDGELADTRADRDRLQKSIKADKPSIWKRLYWMWRGY
ncbi:MAG: hypothetical protein ACXAEN_23145 [Candidatus Thorarchaeota archaeon]|jgi:chromosome segregation ATPase